MLKGRQTGIRCEFKTRVFVQWQNNPCCVGHTQFAKCTHTHTHTHTKKKHGKWYDRKAKDREMHWQKVLQVRFSGNVKEIEFQARCHWRKRREKETNLETKKAKKVKLTKNRQTNKWGISVQLASNVFPDRVQAIGHTHSHKHKIPHTKANKRQKGRQESVGEQRNRSLDD